MIACLYLWCKNLYCNIFLLYSFFVFPWLRNFLFFSFSRFKLWCNRNIFSWTFFNDPFLLWGIKGIIWLLSFILFFSSLNKKIITFFLRSYRICFRSYSRFYYFYLLAFYFISLSSIFSFFSTFFCCY